MKNRNLLPALMSKGMIDSFFEDIWEPAFPFRSEPKIPPVNIEETEKEIIVSAEIPGVDKKDIKIDLNENQLTISFEKKESKEEKSGKHYKLIEQSYGKFTRSFTLPCEVKAKESKAEYKNGVLKLILPKQKETKVHQIKID